MFEIGWGNLKQTENGSLALGGWSPIEDPESGGRGYGGSKGNQIKMK